MARMNFNLFLMTFQRCKWYSSLLDKSCGFGTNPIQRTYFVSKNYIFFRRYSALKIDFLTLTSPYCILKFPNIHGSIVKYVHTSNGKNTSQVSASHVKNVLLSKKIEVTDGYTCFVIKCPCCVNSKKHELYINKVTGFVICSGCKHSGEWTVFEKLLNEKNNNIPSEQLLMKFVNEAGDKWKEMCKTLIPLSSLEFDVKKSVCNKLQLKVLSENICENLNIYVNEELSVIYMPLKCRNEIVGYKAFKLNHEHLDKKDNVNDKDNVLQEHIVTEPVHDCRGILLFKPKSLKKDKVVIVHDIKDFLSLAELNLNYHIVCLPYGLTYLPQEILPLLETYKKIILWFGNDSACWDAARKFSRKLGEGRCYFIRPVKENPPAHIVSIEENDVNKIKDIIEKAESIKHPSIISFSSIRQDVLSELQNIDKAQGVRWKRFPGLNNLLKGFRRGELTIFTGPTGSGKTTFLSEYSLDLLTQGVTTLWGSFEVRNQRLARVMLQQYVQLPLDLYPEKLNCWADSFERLPLHFMTFHGQQPLKVVLEAVEHASYVYDISHVIIDNVQFMLGMLDSETNLDRFYRQDALIASFRNFATTNNCHVTLVIHPRKEKDAELLTVNSVFGGAKASQEADNVLIIQQKMLQSLKIKKYLQIAKNRFTGDLGLIPLDFDKETLSFSTKNEKKQQKKYDSMNQSEDGEIVSKNVPGFEDLHILQ